MPLQPPPWPVADETILAAMQAAFADHTWGNYHGPNLAAFEQELTNAFHVRHAVTCASGTLAVEIALRAAGVMPGDDVILAAYDYEANFLNVHALQAKPVLVDIDSQSGQMDLTHLDAARSPLTKAIIASHLHGGLIPMAELMAWAKSHRITVIEDAAQCPGAIVDGRPAGSWGDLGTLSFGGSKLLAAGRGGAILANDDRLHQRVKLSLSRGIQQWAALSELQAIVLRPQLARLTNDTQTRLRAVNRLIRQLPGNLQPLFDHRQSPAFYKVGFWLNGVDRISFCQQARHLGVPIDPGFSAWHVGRAASRYRSNCDLPNATRLHHQGVVLHHPVLLAGDEMIDRVAEAIRSATTTS